MSVNLQIATFTESLQIYKKNLITQICGFAELICRLPTFENNKTPGCSRSNSFNPSLLALDTKPSDLEDCVPEVDSTVPELDISIPVMDTSVPVVDTSVPVVDTFVSVVDSVTSSEVTSCSFPEECLKALTLPASESPKPSHNCCSCRAHPADQGTGNVKGLSHEIRSV
jgi:hypothetical protein